MTTETNTELLEIMKRRQKWAEDNNERIVTIDKEHFDQLLEQAGRVPELEADATHLAHAWTAKMEENKQLREPSEKEVMKMTDDRLANIEAMYLNDEDLHQFDIEHLIEQAKRVPEIVKLKNAWEETARNYFGENIKLRTLRSIVAVAHQNN